MTLQKLRLKRNSAKHFSWIKQKPKCLKLHPKRNATKRYKSDEKGINHAYKVLPKEHRTIKGCNTVHNSPNPPKNQNRSSNSNKLKKDFNCLNTVKNIKIVFN